MDDAGVIPTPEVKAFDTQPDDAILILASDGVWEFITNDEAVGMVSEYANPQKACRAIVAEAYRLWMQFDVRSDDITAIIAYFDRSERATSMRAGHMWKGRGGSMCDVWRHSHITKLLHDALGRTAQQHELGADRHRGEHGEAPIGMDEGGVDGDDRRARKLVALALVGP